MSTFHDKANVFIALYGPKTPFVIMGLILCIVTLYAVITNKNQPRYVVIYDTYISGDTLSDSIITKWLSYFK